MLHAERQTEALTELAHERLVAIGGGAAQMVVHVQHVQALAGYGRASAPVGDVEPRCAGHDEQRGGVRPA